MKNYFLNGNEYKQVCRKGQYSYDWMDDIDKFDEKKLPSKEDFYNRLNNENISDENYEYVKKVWNIFNCEKFKDYHIYI